MQQRRSNHSEPTRGGFLCGHVETLRAVRCQVHVGAAQQLMEFLFGQTGTHVLDHSLFHQPQSDAALFDNFSLKQFSGIVQVVQSFQQQPSMLATRRRSVVLNETGHDDVKSFVVRHGPDMGIQHRFIVVDEQGRGGKVQQPCGTTIVGRQHPHVLRVDTVPQDDNTLGMNTGVDETASGPLTWCHYRDRCIQWNGVVVLNHVLQRTIAVFRGGKDVGVSTGGGRGEVKRK